MFFFGKTTKLSRILAIQSGEFKVGGSIISDHPNKNQVFSISTTTQQRDRISTILFLFEGNCVPFDLIYIRFKVDFGIKIYCLCKYLK